MPSDIYCGTAGISFRMVSHPRKTDSDGDGISDKNDPLPLVKIMSSALIYQSARPVGKVSVDGNAITSDLTYNDYSKSDLYKINITIGDKANLYDENTILDGEERVFGDFESLGKFFSKGDLQDVILDMIDHFRYGNGADYRNETLTQFAVLHESTQRYINSNTDLIIKELLKNKGNLNALEYVEHGLKNRSDLDFINSIDEVGRPKYNTNGDLWDGLAICVDDTWGNYIEIKDYKFDGNKFSGTICYTIYDHFGLDPADMEKSKKFPYISWFIGNYHFKDEGGFVSWFILQHHEIFEMAYKPFVDYIEFEEYFEGTI